MTQDNVPYDVRPLISQITRLSDRVYELERRLMAGPDVDPTVNCCCQIDWATGSSLLTATAGDGVTDIAEFVIEDSDGTAVEIVTSGGKDQVSVTRAGLYGVSFSVAVFSNSVLLDGGFLRLNPSIHVGIEVGAQGAPIPFGAGSWYGAVLATTVALSAGEILTVTLQANGGTWSEVGPGKFQVALICEGDVESPGE